MRQMIPDGMILTNMVMLSLHPNPTGHQQVISFLGDDDQCLAFISSFKERTVCIVRSPLSLICPMLVHQMIMLSTQY